MAKTKKQKPTYTADQLLHDIKSSFTTTILNLEYLDTQNFKKSIKPDFLQTWELIIESAFQLKQIFDGYEDLVDQNETTINVSSQIKKLAKSYKTKLGTKNIALEVELNTKTKITGNEFIFRQVILNLIENAITAHYRNKKPQKYIKITTNENQGYLLIAVQDNGQGIDQKDLDKVFDYGFTTKKAAKRSGTGLYICQEAVKQAFGGNIKVSSAKGAGSVFLVKIPLS